MVSGDFTLRTKRLKSEPEQQMVSVTSRNSKWSVVASRNSKWSVVTSSPGRKGLRVNRNSKWSVVTSQNSTGQWCLHGTANGQCWLYAEDEKLSEPDLLLQFTQLFVLSVKWSVVTSQNSKWSVVTLRNSELSVVTSRNSKWSVVTSRWGRKGLRVNRSGKWSVWLRVTAPDAKTLFLIAVAGFGWLVTNLSIIRTAQMSVSL